MNHNQKKKQRTILPSLSLVDMIESAREADQAEEQVFFELSPSSRPRLAVLGLDLVPDMASGSDLAELLSTPVSGDALFPASGSPEDGQDFALAEDPASEADHANEKAGDEDSDKVNVDGMTDPGQADEVADHMAGNDRKAGKRDRAAFFLNGWQRQMLAAADVVCAPRFVLDALAADLDRSVTIALAGNGDYLEDQAALGKMADRLISLRDAGRRVLALVSGDPLLHGLGSQLAARMPIDELDIRPASCLPQKMAALLALPWQNVCPVWLGEPTALARIDSEVRSGKAICLLGSDRQTWIPFDHVLHHLLDCGVDWFAVHVLEEGEKIRCLKMEEAVNAGFAPESILFLVPNAPARCPGQGLDARQLADHHGKYSSLAVRSCALGLMAIEPDHLVWIIGAGNGALALEAASLAHRGRIVAVEANPAMVLTMEENRRRFGAANLDILAQHAPECLHSLPAADRIFVAGGLNGGEASASILAAVCEALRPGGRLVAGFDLFQSLVFCRSSLELTGWHTELCQLQVTCATSVDPVRPDSMPLPGAWERLVHGAEDDAGPGRWLASDFRLVAENPVFLLAAQKTY